MDAPFAAPIGALLIFCLRIVDVSMATVRIIVAVRGRRALAAWIGFVEVLIWVIAAGHALQHLDSILHIVGYAVGFGVGSYVGVWLGARFAIGLNVVRAVCSPGQDIDEVSVGKEGTQALRDEGFEVTEVMGLLCEDRRPARFLAACQRGASWDSLSLFTERLLFEAISSVMCAAQQARRAP